MNIENKKILDHAKIKETLNFFQKSFTEMSRKLLDLYDCVEYMEPSDQKIIFNGLEQLRHNIFCMSQHLESEDHLRLQIKEDISVLITRHFNGVTMSYFDQNIRQPITTRFVDDTLIADES